MNISRIVVDGLKNVRVDIPITKNRLAIAGAVGAGKSTIVDAIRFILLQDTRMGTTQLNRFGASGWTASLTINGATYTAGVNSRGSVWLIDGMPMNKASYEAAIDAICRPKDVTDMAAFLNLSDTSRGQMVASLMGLEATTLEAALRDAEEGDESFTLAKWWGPGVPAVTGTFRGTSSEIVVYTEKVQRAVADEVRTQQAELQLLVDMNVEQMPVESIKDLEAMMARMNQELGAIKSEIAEAENRDKSRVAATASLERLKEKATKLRVSVDGAAAAQETWLKACDEQVKMQKRTVEAVRSVELFTKQADNANNWPDVLTALSAKLVAGEYKEILGDHSDFIRKLDQITARLISERGKSTANLEAAKKALASCQRDEIPYNVRVGDAVSLISKINLDTIALKSLEETIVIATGALQEMISPIDKEAAGVLRDSKMAEIEAVHAKIVLVRGAAAKSDRISEIRTKLTDLTRRSERMKDLLMRLKCWKDLAVRKAAAGMMDAVSGRLQVLMKLPKLVLTAADSGKGLNLMLNMGNKTVSIDDLSDGECVLFAAAMLPSLQRGPSKILTLNTEALDAPSLSELLRVAGDPAWTDFAVVANNRLDTAQAKEDGWDTVTIEQGRVA